MSTLTPDIALVPGGYPHVATLFDALTLGIVYQDSAGHITTANAAAQRILGLSLNQMRGLTSIDPRWHAIHEDASAFPGSEHPAMVALATGKPVLDVKMGVLHAGSEGYRWLNVCAYPAEAHPGAQPEGVVAVFEDISQQRQLDQSQKASELRFLSLFEAMSEGLALHEMVFSSAGEAVNYRILDVNPAYEAQTSIERERVVGKLATDAYGLVAAPFLEIYARVARTQQPIKFEQYFEPLKRHFLIKVFSPAPNQFATVFSDITERLLLEQTLRESKTLITSVVDSLTEHVAVVDAHGVIISVNASWRRFAKDNGATNESLVSLGANYLDVCADACATAEEAGGAAAMNGILSVLTGAASDFTMEYPCHSPTQERWFELHVVPLLGSGGGAVLIHENITDRKSAAKRIEHLAFYDALTQLPNRRLMVDRLNQARVNSTRRGRHGAVLMIDLDNFKTLNDTLGHDVGDQLLIAVAQRLQTCVRVGDTVSRLGGDEFVVLLDELDAGDLAALQVETVADKILDHLTQPYTLQPAASEPGPAHVTHQCTASIGAVLFLGQSASADELLKRADTAMYQAKAAGRNALRFFDPRMQTAVATRATLESDLRRAIQDGEFVLHYQPQVNAAGHMVGAESLVRWQHPGCGLLAPGNFIAVAEETGMILPIGEWVLHTACTQLAAWARQSECAHLTLAVNVSANQCRSPTFVQQVLAILRDTGARADRLELELTESLLLENKEDIIAKMRALKDKGIRFSLDDFGTGYSSLAYLKRLPLDQLKIDKSFIDDVLTDPNDGAIARTVVALSQSLGLSVIAEGVETVGQRDFLAQAGCNLYQGFLFSPPLPLTEFSAFLQSQQTAA